MSDDEAVIYVSFYFYLNIIFFVKKFKIFQKSKRNINKLITSPEKKRTARKSTAQRFRSLNKRNVNQHINKKVRNKRLIYM